MSEVLGREDEDRQESRVRRGTGRSRRGLNDPNEHGETALDQANRFAKKRVPLLLVATEPGL